MTRGILIAVALTAAVGCSQEEVGETTQLSCACTPYSLPCCCSSPIVLDLAGDGLAFTDAAKGVSFELAAGKIGPWSWTEAGADDAWLVLDRSGNGVIDNGIELFSSWAPQPRPAAGQKRHGFAALAELDEDGDDWVNQSDPLFDELRLWRDDNHDGRTQADELLLLSDHGVEGLSVGYSQVGEIDKHGNAIMFSAPLRLAVDSTVNPVAYDVFLASATPQERRSMGLADQLDPQAPLVAEELLPGPDKVFGGTGPRSACVVTKVSPPPYREWVDDLGRYEIFSSGGWQGQGTSCPTSKSVRNRLHQKYVVDGQYYLISEVTANRTKNIVEVMNGSLCPRSTSTQWFTANMVDGSSLSSSAVTLACDNWSPPSGGGCNDD